MKESMWGILRRNGYKKKSEEEKKKELRGKQEREKRKEEGRWYGLTSMGRYIEKLKGVMRREGIRTFRKGGEKLERRVKEGLGRRKEDKEEEGVVYKVKCKDCDKIYIGETTFKMKKRIDQHKKDVQFGRTIR